MRHSSWVGAGAASLILLFLLILPSYALDRCNDYIADVKIQHYKYFGIDFPYHYGVAQLEAESRCRPNVTAKDKGMGIGQFMPATWKGIKDQLGEPDLDPYNPEHAIKAQAFFMWQIHK